MNNNFLILLLFFGTLSFESRSQVVFSKKTASLEQLTTGLIKGEIDSTSYNRELKRRDRISAKSSRMMATSSAMQTMSVGQIYYVNSSAQPGNGLSWATAFNDLQDALSIAVSGDEIWVANGTYKPTPTASRSVYFRMKSGVALYGGFAGTETTREDRDWRTNITALSGDIGSSSITDNSDHVLYASSVSDVVLDGFTIENGYASSSYLGGGLYCTGSSNVVVQNCVFSRNTSDYHGGGMYVAGNTSIQVINSVFKNNRATSYDGGGIFMSGAGDKKIIGCLFYGNDCGRIGGALEVYGTTCYVVNSTFSANDDNGVSGGGSISSYAASTYLYNSIFYGNSSPNNEFAKWGSGRIYVYTSLVEASTYYNTGNNIIRENPLFQDAAALDFKLQTGSPCIDAGLSSITGVTYPDTDLDGNVRIFNDAIDIGSYEKATAEPKTFYAIASGNWSDGSIWSHTIYGPPSNKVPHSADTVYVLGHDVVVDSEASCTYLYINNQQSESSVNIIANQLTVIGEVKIERENNEGGEAVLNVQNTGRIAVVTNE